MTGLGFLLRASFIWLVAWWSLLRYLVLRVGLFFVRDPALRRSRVARLRGRVLRGAMETLGATFIKLGQVMSTRPDLFAPEIIAELRQLQDRLPAFPDARRAVERELGAPMGELFREFDDVPIAAASVAQVHRAVLRASGPEDGTEVAVKVLRPDVRAKAERDGRILRFFARGLELISGRARHAELADHLQHFIDGIVEQTDLRIEARNYERFRQNFRKVKKVRFPKVFPERSGARVMTMEFVRGEKVDAIPREELPEGFARHLREVFLKMCFDDGFLHADLHPGNFIVSEDGTLTIFDVGLVKELSEELLEYYIDFNRCLVMGDVEDFMHHMRKYHSYVEGTVDWAELEKDVASFNEEWRTRSTRELEFGQLIDKVFETGRKHGVRPVPEMTLMMVGLVTAEGIGKQLEPEVNSFQEVANYLVPVLARRNMLSPAVMEAAARMSERMLAEDSARG